MKNILCLYYSRTGLTKNLITRIAEELDAELVEYTDGKERKGVLGYLSCCKDAIFSKKVTVNELKTERALSDYSHVVIAMPVWVESPCILAKKLLSTYKDQLPHNVHFVVTHMAPLDYEKSIVKLDKLLNAPHKSHLSVSTKKGDYEKQINDFIQELK